ncbi:hypothetical protein WJX74_010178 [Apatococcus lobatus]|uniref:ABM domain-containing protein n=1 Tax=Apatococcus lobatus TaxID=904363 RepID=A0AAW1QXR3_9CHLO
MKTSLIAVCLACVAGTALAASRDVPQITSASSGFDVIQMITQTLTNSGHLTHAVNKDPEDKKAYVLVDYAVPPSKQDEFIAAFQKTAGPTKDEEGSIVYTLSRTVDENLSFYLYSEWDGQKAVAEHFNSSYLKDYLKTIADLNVVYKLHILEPVVY